MEKKTAPVAAAAAATTKQHKRVPNVDTEHYVEISSCNNQSDSLDR